MCIQSREGCRASIRHLLLHNQNHNGVRKMFLIGRIHYCMSGSVLGLLDRKFNRGTCSSGTWEAMGLCSLKGMGQQVVEAEGRMRRTHLPCSCIPGCTKGTRCPICRGSREQRKGGKSRFKHHSINLEDKCTDIQCDKRQTHRRSSGHWYSRIQDRLDHTGSKCQDLRYSNQECRVFSLHLGSILCTISDEARSNEKLVLPSSLY